MTEPTKTVAALAPDGTPIELPAAEASALQHSQGRLLSPAEEAKVRHDVELQNKLGGLEGYIAPPLVGAARGLTLGLSDQALASVPALRGRLSDYEEFAPQAVQGGELIGTSLGALAGFGAPALAERAGIAANRVAGTLGRGAVEGAIFGGGDAIGESALTDHGLSGEALIGGAAHGALGGIVANGALGLVGKTLGSFRGGTKLAEGFDSLAENIHGESATGVGRSLADAEAEVAATSPYRRQGLGDVAAAQYIDAIPAATPTERAKLSEAWGNRERVFQKNAEVVETASRDFSNALNDALESGRKADMASFGEAKQNQMSKLVDVTKSEAQAERTFNWLLDADPMVKKLAEDPNSHLTKGDLKQWNGWMSELSGAIENRNSLQMHTSLDAMKRWVGKQAEFGKGPFGLSRAAREFDALYQGQNGLKELLEDEVWGAKASRAQKEINAATTNMLSEGKLFTRKFTTEFGSQEGRPLYAADTSAVSGFMNRLTSAANDLDAKGVESWIQARRHFLDATTRNYTFDAGTMSAVAKEREALDKLASVYKQTSKDVTLANQVRGALSEERERGIGGAIGAVFDVASKPYTTLQRLAQIETQTKGVINRIGLGTKSVVNGGAKPASAEGRGFFSSLLDGFTNGKGSGKTAASSFGASTSRALFQKRSDQIATLQANPVAVSQRISDSMGPISHAAPGVVQNATETTMRGLDFLASKLPPPRQDAFSLQPQFQPPTRASDAEVSRFMRFADAVDDPLIVLREAKTNTLTRDHVEAVKAVYPKLYDEIRGSVFQQLVESKSELPYARRIQLGILLDIPTDKTLDPAFIRAVQATYVGADQAEAESPPQTSAAPNIASSFQTATQSAVEPAQ